MVRRKGAVESDKIGPETSPDFEVRVGSGPIESQAILCLTFVGGQAILTTYGSGDARECMEGVCDALRALLSESPRFKVEEPQ